MHLMARRRMRCFMRRSQIFETCTNLGARSGYTKGSKLNGCVRVGCWLGFDSKTSQHQIYWKDNCSIGVERSMKFNEREDTKVKESILNEGENKEEGIQPTFSVKNAKNIPNPASVPLPHRCQHPLHRLLAGPVQHCLPTHLHPHPTPSSSRTSLAVCSSVKDLTQQISVRANTPESHHKRPKKWPSHPNYCKNCLQHCPRPATLKCQ